MSNFKTWLRKMVVMLTVSAFTMAHGAEVVSYYHNDISGSPILATDASGNVLWKENYRPYGDKLNKQAASASNKIGFHGKPYDDNTGLSYMGARYYDPVLGRFAGIDPAGVNPDDIYSFNRYAYANNNPHKYVDPDGRISELMVVVAVVGGLLMLTSMAEHWRQMQGQTQSNSLAQRLTEAVGRLRDNATHNETANNGNSGDAGSGTSGANGGNASDEGVKGVTGGLSSETDKKGRPVKGQYVNTGGNAQSDLDSLPGAVGENGQKTLPDGSVAGVHTSTTTGAATLHINRPSGKQDVKIRYPDTKKN